MAGFTAVRPVALDSSDDRPNAQPRVEMCDHPIKCIESRSPSSAALVGFCNRRTISFRRERRWIKTIPLGSGFARALGKR